MKNILMAVGMLTASVAVYAADAYIDTDGTQVVVLDYYAKPQTRIVADFAYLSVTPTQSRVFGASGPGAGFSCASYINGSGQYAFAFRDDDGDWTSTGITVTTDRRTFEIDGPGRKATLYTGGEATKAISLSSPATVTSVFPLVLFGTSKDPDALLIENPGSKVRLYSLAVWDGETQVMDLRPALKNGVYLLKDAVTGKCYGPARGNALTGGGDIETVTGTLTWTGAAGTADWNTAENWQVSGGETASFPPGAGDAVQIAGNVTVDISGAKSKVASLTISGGGTVTLTGKRLEILATSLSVAAGSGLNIDAGTTVYVPTASVGGSALGAAVYAGGSQSWISGGGALNVGFVHVALDDSVLVLDVPPGMSTTYGTALAAYAEVVPPYDVIVAGGGPAGIGAGYIAAARGAKTLVLEKSGRLGGMGVSALVSPFSFCTVSPIAKDIAKKIGFEHSVDFHLADVRAYDLLREAGADVLLHADVLGPTMEGNRVTGVRVQCAEGERTFRAKVVIDATGNGVVAAAAGVPYEEGRPGDGLVQPMSIMFTVGGFDPARRFKCYSEEQARSKQCLVNGRTWEDIVQDEIKVGRLPPEVGVIRLYPGRENGLNVVNATQVNGLFGTRSADLTKAEIAARKQAAQIVDVMRRHLPGYENACIAEMPAVVGVRETRRFEGVDRLTTEDVLSGRTREDAIARRCSFVIDIHNPAGAGQADGHDKAVTGGARRVKPYDIPYGALVPKKVDGLLFCGRCLSASHEALASCRVMGNAMATGVGAGAAAAQAVKEGIDVRAVDARKLGLFPANSTKRKDSK